MVFGNSLLPEINSPIVGGKPSHRSRQDLEKHNPNGKVSGEVPGGFWKHPPCRLERLNSG